MSWPLGFLSIIFILISTKAILIWRLWLSCKYHFISLTYIIISFTVIICNCQCQVNKSPPFRPFMIQLVFMGHQAPFIHHSLVPLSNSNILGCFDRAAHTGGFLTIQHPRWVAHLKSEHPRCVSVFEFQKSDEN